MIASLSLSSLVLGVGLSYAATRKPGWAGTLGSWAESPEIWAETCETWSGRLLVAGLGLLGAGLPLFR